MTPIKTRILYYSRKTGLYPESYSDHFYSKGSLHFLEGKFVGLRII
jgi:hypothetical protein